MWHGKKDKVNVYTKEDIYKTIPKARKKHLKAVVNYNGPIEAPIEKDQIIGKLTLTFKDELVEEYDLLAFESVKKVNMFSRILRSINYLIWGDV